MAKLLDELQLHGSLVHYIVPLRLTALRYWPVNPLPLYVYNNYNYYIYYTQCETCCGTKYSMLQIITPIV